MCRSMPVILLLLVGAVNVSIEAQERGKTNVLFWQVAAFVLTRLTASIPFVEPVALLS